MTRIRVKMVSVHAEGEIGQIAYDGLPDIPGKTIASQLQYLEQEGQALRNFLTSEPRGVCQQSVNLLLPPKDSRADAGLIVLQPDQAHAMSGSNAICTVTMLIEKCLVQVKQPETKIVLDTASGLVEAIASVAEDGRCERVTLTMPFAYVDQDQLTIIDTEGQTISLSVCFGGVFYALVNADQLDLNLIPEHANSLVNKGLGILDSARRQYEPRHPEYDEIKGFAYLMFYSHKDHERRNATIMRPGRIDRCPCGTGSNARLALMALRQEALAGDRIAFTSLIGSRFDTQIVKKETRYSKQGIIATVSGRGWLFGEQTVWQAPGDPFIGHRLSDCW